MKGLGILAVLLGLAAVHFIRDGTLTHGTAPFRNCAAARAAGPTPIFRGHPRWSDDLDGDGRACEPMQGNR
ncbi:excalibur calcium-binding domain-containing protein [Sphingomonas sp. SM33]|uniref:Excalibur calcium-binding domain-containing protein n=1 Tax=Sphingomonas telluris TaxID=2907998 RepID=A0ABS9VRD9_9SPHN|nr:excalibur calcium-binding domain-containing protein [Sphingomonas telluris]MCH8617154.1 excalibur calcium-binding domain-containing protein [Sphingomonas telluris]